MVWLSTAIFGVLVLAGGCAGYARARSVVSLAFGFVCGAVLLWAAYAVRGGHEIGVTLAAAVSLLLLLIFARRWARTKKFMPAGLLLLLSTAELAVLFFFG